MEDENEKQLVGRNWAVGGENSGDLMLVDFIPALLCDVALFREHKARG